MGRAKDPEAEAQNARIKKILAGEAFAAMEKKWGSNVLIVASDDRVQDIPRIPSGVFMLDWALGGGWPAGRVNTVYGFKSSSKTTILLKTIGNAQKLCGNCWSPPIEGKCRCGKFRDVVAAMVDTEGTWDKKWSTSLGVDNERLLYSRTDYAEQALDIVEALLREGDVDIIMLDSLAFLVPSAEIEKSTEQDTIGLQARLIGKGIRKFTAALNSTKNEHDRSPTLFLTNQIRMKAGLVFGNPEVQPGGYAPGFAATTEVRFSAGKYEIDENTGIPLHVDINFKVEKNKAGSPKMEGSYRLLLSATETKKAGDIYEEDALVNVAQKFGMVEGHGSSWTCMGEDFRAKSLIEKKLVTEPEYRAKFKETLMKIVLSI